MLTNYTVGKFTSDKIEFCVIFKNLWDGGMICASLRWANISEHLLISAVQTQLQSKVTFYLIDKVEI